MACRMATLKLSELNMGHSMKVGGLAIGFKVLAGIYMQMVAFGQVGGRTTGCREIVESSMLTALWNKKAGSQMMLGNNSLSINQ